MSLRGDLEALVRAKRRDGWQIERTRKGHYRWMFIETGAFFISPTTPSDHRAFLNVKADIRRREKPTLSDVKSRFFDAIKDQSVMTYRARDTWVPAPH